MNIFGKMSVRWKIYAIAIVSLIGFAAYLGFNHKVNTDNAELLAEIRDLHFPILEKAKFNRERMERINEQFNTAVVIADTDFVEEAVLFAQDLYRSMDEAIKLSPSDTLELAGIKGDFAIYLNQVKSLSTSMIEGTIDFDQLASLAAKKEEALAKATQRQDAYIAYALNRFNESIKQANSNSEFLLQSGFVLWLINVFILGVTAIAIAKLILTNIISVSTSLEEIAAGSGNLDQNIPVKSSDEIGQLAVSFNHLMEKLREKTNDLMSMMQNMHQGLFTVTLQDDKLLIHSEYSAYIEEIFEASEIAGSRYDELLFKYAKLGSDQLDQIITAMDAIVKEDEMMFDCNAHLLPSEVICEFPERRDSKREDGSPRASHRKILELEWDPIIADGIVDKMMITVRDVTALRAAAKEAEEQKQELEIIGQILKISPSKFDSFIENARQLLSKNEHLIKQTHIKDLDVVAELFANMHTIKGNARTYGFKFITDLVHDAETHYDQLRKDEDVRWDPTQLLIELAIVADSVERYASIKSDKLNLNLGNTQDKSIVPISRSHYESIVEQLDGIVSENSESTTFHTINGLAKEIRKLDTQPLSNMISEIVDSLPSLAQQLEKAPPNIQIHDNGVGIKTKHSELLNNVFTHLLRNSIDHGIETREERKEHGKPAQGTIDLDIHIEGEQCVMTLKDDGRGLALKKIKTKAEASGAVNLGSEVSAQDIANLLFASGISTAEEVSDISGRGVGMDAVQKFLRAQQADIQVKLLGEASANDDFAPFEMRLTLPKNMVEL